MFILLMIRNQKYLGEPNKIKINTEVNFLTLLAIFEGLNSESELGRNNAPTIVPAKTFNNQKKGHTIGSLPSGMVRFFSPADGSPILCSDSGPASSPSEGDCVCTSSPAPLAAAVAVVLAVAVGVRLVMEPCGCGSWGGSCG